jgi:S-layer family protein
MRNEPGLRAMLCGLLLAGVSGPLAAEELVAGVRVSEVVSPLQVPDPRTEPWGGAAASAKTIHALGFQESESGMTFSYSGATTHRFRTGGSSFFWFDADVDVPSGAQLMGLELEGCDTSATQHIAVFLFRKTAPGGVVAQVGAFATTDAATPGCVFVGGPANLPANVFVDNRNTTHFVRVEMTGTTEATSFGGVRLFYKLRVSPAPAVATFGDVPTTNGFFQFVEALAASGITGGCGGGNFCPDNPVTRGQMAVFLAAALGLHFPN